MPINVGVSELPGRTDGVMQKMSNVQAGLNLRAAISELRLDYDEIVTVNEADRSRPDQQLMFQQMPITGILAAKPFTSTHDPENYGNAADLGGPGGAVLGGTRAHRLLDGNHPDGVVGRKWGIYNTGAGFWKPESWHFNIFPARAQRLATLADSTPGKPDSPDIPQEEDDMSDVHIIGDKLSKTQLVQNNVTGIDKKIEAGDGTDLSILVNKTGKLPEVRIAQLNERYLRPIGILGALQLAVDRGIIPGKQTEK